ncbi:MAG: acyl-CoA dehydratase activase [Promethearchaeota archaeon]
MSKEINFEGLEVGTVSVKWVRTTEIGANQSEIIRHEGSPREIIERIFKKYNVNGNSKILITGHATRKFLSLPYFSEAECLEKALSFHNIQPDILLSLGGETFSVFPMKNGVIKNIISTTKCAAGTGEFIVQQLQRMGLSLDQGIKESKNGSFTKLATRCSVHCKSDATHKLNKGECLPKDVARTLIYDLAKKVSEMIYSVKWPTNSIVIAGGVGLNSVFIENLKELLPNTKFQVLPESAFLEAFGAALMASDFQGEMPPFDEWLCPENIKFEARDPLFNMEPLVDFRVNPDLKINIEEGGKYILGIDAGSTTTKAVLLNIEDKTVGAKEYLRTLGNPIAATKKCLESLIKQIGDININIVQCSVTGSAREMVSVYMDNCYIFNEILAHAKSATEELPNVYTVFEIGGQDSKFISFLKGVPIDYAMNEGCSAGTGSFLEESASVDMGVAVEDISNIAINSKNPIAFGERCAAFINTDLRNALQQGAKQEDVIAGLVYSIADNYISRIIGPRHIGENILFLGGVALNKSVALAIAACCRRKVIVPEHPELMGAIGTALLALDLSCDNKIPDRDFKLGFFLKGEMQVKNTFRCNACENLCEIQNIMIRGHKYPFGGYCSKYRLIRNNENIEEGKNLVEWRNKLIYEKYGPKVLKEPNQTIGIPMALTSHSLFPLYVRFINEIGCNVVLSDAKKLESSKLIGSICYPCELLYTAVVDLIQKGVDHVFLPYIIELDIPSGYLHGYTCPSTAGIPDIVRAALEKKAEKILSPHLSLSVKNEDITIRELVKVAKLLGIDSNKSVKAAQVALSYYYAFLEEYHTSGEKKLEEIAGESSVVVAGRPYVIYPSEVNLALPRKIVSRGYHVIPADLLPHIDVNNAHNRNVWAFTQQIDNAIHHVQQNPNLYICLISCFSCGPDSIIYHHFRQELEGSTFCYLEIDSHTAHTGFETRVEAFLDIIEERRKKMIDEIEVL